MATKKQETPEQEERVNIFQTRDINLAAYMKLKGYKIKNILTDKSRCIFGFEDKKVIKEREQDVMDYYNNKGAFQVEEIKHAIDASKWTTEVIGHYRPFSK